MVTGTTFYISTAIKVNKNILLRKFAGLHICFVVVKCSDMRLK